MSKNDNFCKPLQLLQTPLDAILIGSYQFDDTFVAFPQVGIFRFMRNSLFSTEDVHSLSRSPPSTKSSQSPALGWRPDLSRYYQHIQRSKIYEKLEGCTVNSLGQENRDQPDDAFVFP